ncbi:ABC transporter ATP-binding protein YtrB [Oceanobacillus picturae]|uniref:ABC transporter ATP-binding protein YtrB n=1 Tax=Oceanobacillus picturae TaxID=171693 RepID=A0A0U9H415_9BACI|nr:ABC transporter ATP-binding protein [Oceanobacillus picturae]GAQ17083.1 ABC transporter ATP-binding protein YtrB [Oceanobacillus picturae]
MKALAEVKQVQKNVDEFKLGPVSLSIEAGTITALVGTNGSGKSTLLKLMMNLAKADAGNIKIHNMFVNGLNEEWKTHIAYQPQTMIGWDAFSGKALRDFIAPLYPAWDDQQFNDIIQAFSVPLNKRFGKLSQGMQQKLILALTVARNTSILLLDEPTAFMDIPSKQKFIDLLIEWMESGDRAIVMSTHQVDDIMKLADYLCVLQEGKWMGTYEKETIQHMYCQYWMRDALPSESLPGEVSREGNQFITSKPEAMETYMREHDLHCVNQRTLGLEESLSLLLNK